MIVEITTNSLATLQDKIGKLNRKALKLGCSPITFTVLGTVFHTVKDDITGEDKTYKLYQVDVTGDAPKLNDWVFLASIQHTNSGNVLKSLDNAISLEAYRTGSAICEHCNTTRNRRDTYIVRNIATGVLKQVGSDCLKDFTGHSNPEAIASLYDKVLALFQGFDDDREYRSYGNSEPVFNLQFFLSVVCAVIRSYGWVSRKQFQETGTPATCTLANYYYDGKNEEKLRSELGGIKPEDTELAKQAIAWIRGVNPDNDYMHNLKTVCGADYAEYRHAGIACSLINAYQRELAKNAPVADKNESAFIGTVGKRQIFNVTVKNVYSVDTMYGILHINIMADDAGNCIVWKTGKNELNTGETVTLKGTVKEHTEYKGIKQTVLSRCIISNA